MRIKLRLYSRDLDIIALKYMPGFKLGAAIREALLEYVNTGHVSQIAIDACKELAPLPQMDQIEVSFIGEKYLPVAKWITGLKPGFRSAAIKTVVRAAIGNPILDMYAINSKHLVREEDESDKSAPWPTANISLGSGTNPNNYERKKNDNSRMGDSEAVPEASPTDFDEDLDLLEFDAFENI